MDIAEFLENFMAEFDETPQSAFSPETKFKELEEWNSLTALSIISMVDDVYEKTITGADLRSVETIQELADLVNKR